MIREMANYIFSLIEVGSVLFIPWSILSKRFTGKKGLILFFLFITIGASAINLMSMNMFLKPLVLLTILGVFCHAIIIGKLYIKIFYLILGMYIVVASEMFMANIVLVLPQHVLLKILESVLIETIFSMAIKIAVIICGIILVRYINKLQPKLPIVYWCVLNAMYIIFIEILQLCMSIETNLKANNDTETMIYIIILSYVLLIISVGIISFFGKICWAYEKQTEFEVFQIRSNELDKVINYQEHVAAELKNLRHDMNKHIANISHLLNQEQISQARKYTEQLSIQIDDIKPIIKSGNYIVDAILSKYSALCNSKNIKLSLIIDEVSQLKINPVDLSAIIDNLLDNAIGAVMKCHKNVRHITVKYFLYKESLALKIINPYNEELKFDDGLLLTSKNELKEHGYGLKSVKTAVERNNGDFKYYIEDNRFTVVIILPLT